MESALYFATPDYRPAILQTGPEAPLAHRFNRFLVEPQSDSLNNFQITWTAGLVDLHVNDHDARVPRLASLLGVFWVHPVHYDRPDHSSTRPANAASDAATCAESKASAAARPDATTL